MRLDFGSYQRSSTTAGPTMAMGRLQRGGSTGSAVPAGGRPERQGVPPALGGDEGVPAPATLASVAQEEVIGRRKTEDREWHARTNLLELVTTEQRLMVDEELRDIATKVSFRKQPKGPPRRSDTRTRSHSPMVTEILPSCPLPAPAPKPVAGTPAMTMTTAPPTPQAMPERRVPISTPAARPVFGRLDRKRFGAEGGPPVGGGGGLGATYSASRNGPSRTDVRTKSPQAVIPMSSLRSMSQGQPPPPSYEVSTSVTAFALKRYANAGIPKQFAVSPPSPSVSTSSAPMS